MSAWPVLAPLTCLALGVLAALAGFRRVASIIYTVVSLAVFIHAFYVLCEPEAAVVVRLRLPLPPPYPQSSVILAEDWLAAAFVSVASVSWVVASLMHILYWRVEEDEPPRTYTALLGAAIASMYVLILSRDFITLLVSWELMSFILACMIAYARDIGARKASLLYLILAHITSLPMFAIIAYLLATGVTWYNSIPEWITPYALSAFMLAFMTKSGLAPLYFWLPPAHSRAPSDASVILSGASVKPPILQALLMLTSLGAPVQAAVAVLVFAVASIVVGCAGALWSREGKRVLAYTTVAYMGLAWLLAALYTLVGCESILRALLAILAAHAAYKSVAFMAVGVAKALWGTDSFSDPVGLCIDASYCKVAAIASMLAMPIPPLAHFLGDFVALTLLSSSSSVIPRVYTYLASAAIASTAVAVGVAYTRIVALLQTRLESRHAPAPHPLLAAAIVAAVAVPITLAVLTGFDMTILALVAAYATILFAALAGGSLLSRYTPRAPRWLSGEEAVYAKRVPPASSPIAAPKPRYSIESILFRVKRPEIHEVGYEGVYTRLSRVFADAILRPLITPVRSGNLGLYIAIILVYFVILVFVGGWLAP